MSDNPPNKNAGNDFDIDQFMDEHFNNEESSRLSDKYSVFPGYSGRYELFSCNSSLQGRQGERFRRLVAEVAEEFDIDPGLLAVNSIAEKGISTYLRHGAVGSAEVGLDYWESLQRSVRGQGRGHIHARRTGETFVNEQGNSVPRYNFDSGTTALRAMAATLKYYDQRIRNAAGRELPKVVRFALIRYAFNAKPTRVQELAREASRNSEILIDDGPAGPKHPLRTATIRAVQAIQVSETFFD